jgi:hypothetical protein
MPKLTNDAREIVMDELEAVLLAGKYNGRAQHHLALRHNVSRRTIRTYRRQLEAHWAKEAAVGDMEVERVKWLVRVRQAQSKSLELGELRNLASFLAMEARVLGIDQHKIKVEHSGNVGVLHASLEQFASVLPGLSPAQIEAMLLPEPPVIDVQGEVVGYDEIPLIEGSGA